METVQCLWGIGKWLYEWIWLANLDRFHLDQMKFLNRLLDGAALYKSTESQLAVTHSFSNPSLLVREWPTDLDVCSCLDENLGLDVVQFGWVLGIFGHPTISTLGWFWRWRKPNSVKWFCTCSEFVWQDQSLREALSLCPCDGKYICSEWLDGYPWTKFLVMTQEVNWRLKSLRA